MSTTAKFKTSDAVDFLIVGSGSAGGVLAKELSSNGFQVVVLEQGPRMEAGQFEHDRNGRLQALERILERHAHLIGEFVIEKGVELSDRVAAVGDRGTPASQGQGQALPSCRPDH